MSQIRVVCHDIFFEASANDPSNGLSMLPVPNMLILLRYSIMPYLIFLFGYKNTRRLLLRMSPTCVATDAAKVRTS